MKYLFENPHTRDLLTSWVGEVSLVVAGFFFWYPGTDIQKSQNGLLRSLLFQILVQQPKLIPIVFPNSWRKYQARELEKRKPSRLNEGTQWNFFVEDINTGRKELIRAITKATTQDVFPLKVCLFVDGLDEFVGDHSEIVGVFKMLASSPFTKLCLSSRP
jgi:hypothetical protein